MDKKDKETVLTGVEWKKQIKEPMSAAKEFGWRPGSRGIRHMKPFRLIEFGKPSDKRPIEGSLWAKAEFADEERGQGRMINKLILIDPHCKDHPLTGLFFSIRNHPGTWVVAGVEVVDEIRKRVKIMARYHSRDSDIDIMKSITTKWPTKAITELANNDQLRLESPHLNEPMKIKGVTGGFKLKIKTKKAHPPLQVGMVEARNQAHLNAISERVSFILSLAVDEVWNPDYAKDDRKKRTQKHWRIAGYVAGGVLVTALAVTVAIAAFPAVVVGGTAATATSSALLTTSGGSFIVSGGTTTAAASATLFSGAGLVPSIWATFGTIAVLSQMMPYGAPASLYKSVNRQVMAEKLARSNLNFAEDYGSKMLATEKCPLGRGLKENNNKDPYDKYAMCWRQKLDDKSLESKNIHEKTMRDFFGQEKTGKNKGGHKNKWSKALAKFIDAKTLMREVATAIGTTAQFECEVLPDDQLKQNFRMREKWTMMPRRNI